MSKRYRTIRNQANFNLRAFFLQSRFLDFSLIKIYVVMNVAQGYSLKSQKGGVLPKHTSLWQVLYKQVYNSDKGLDIDRI